MKFPDNFAAKLEVLKIVLPWCDIFGFPLVAKAEVRCCHFTRNSIKSIIYCGNSVLKDFSLQCFYCIFINKTNLPVIFFFRTAFCVWFQLLKKGLCAPPKKKTQYPECMYISIFSHCPILFLVTTTIGTNLELLGKL